MSGNKQKGQHLRKTWVFFLPLKAAECGSEQAQLNSLRRRYNPMLSAMTAARKSCAREKDARCAFRKEWRAEKIRIDNVVRTVKAGWAQERRRCTDKGEGGFEVGTFSLAEGQTSPVGNHYTVSSTAKNSFVGVKNFQTNLMLAIFSKATTLVVAISKHSARLSCRARKNAGDPHPLFKTQT